MPAFAPGRPRVLLGTAAVVLLLVVLLATSGREDDDIRLVRGVPDAGFPVRGDGARDDALIRSAADAWRRRASREEDYWAGQRRPRITVLWAGRLTDAGGSGPAGADTDGVVLAIDRQAAFLERTRGSDHWQISAAAVERDDDPRIVVAGDAVLLRTGRDGPTFRPAEPEGDGSPRLVEQDGLWHREGTALPAGALLLPRGVPGRFTSADAPAPAAVFTGRTAVVRRLSPTLLERLRSGPESRVSPAARRLNVAAHAAAGTPDRDRDRDRDRRPPPSPGDAPTLDLVSDRASAPLGPVLVLSVERSPGALGTRDDDRASLVAAAGGGGTGGPGSATAIELEGTDLGRRGARGPALGAAYVRPPEREDAPAEPGGDRRPEEPHLLVAGDRDVVRIQVLTGRRTIDLRGPVGVVPAPWLRASTRGAALDADVAVLGRTDDGALVVPGSFDDTPVSVGDG